MAWSANFDDTFGRANGAPGNGWAAEAASVWSLSGGKLVGSTSDTSGYLTRGLLRPASEAQSSSRIVAKATAPFNDTGLAVGLRRQAGAQTYYLAQLAAGLVSAGHQIYIYAIVGGAVTNLSFGAPSVGIVSGRQYALDFSAVGTNPTVLTLTATDLTTSTVIYTVTINDSTAGLQVAGVPQMSVWVTNSGGTTTQTYDQVTTYAYTTAVPGLTVSPTSATVTGGGTVSITPTRTNSTAALAASVSGGGTISTTTPTSGTAFTYTAPGSGSGTATVTVTDATDGLTATTSVSYAPAVGTLRLGAIGDSITSGTNGDPFAACVAYLQAQGFAVPTPVNRGVSGWSTTDWLPSGSTLGPAIAAFQAAGVTLVQIMLGTNDGRTPNNLTAAQSAANLRLIIAAVVAAGMKVVLHHPVYSVPGAAFNGVVWPSDVNARYQATWAALAPLANGVNVFIGDTGAFAWSSIAPGVALNADGIHPADGPQNTILGKYWAIGIMQRWGVPQTYRGGFARAV